MKVKFLKSPTAVFGLGYFEGDEAEMEKKQAALLIEAGYAEAVTAPEQDMEPEVKPKGKAKK